MKQIMEGRLNKIQFSANVTASKLIVDQVARMQAIKDSAALISAARKNKKESDMTDREYVKSVYSDAREHELFADEVVVWVPYLGITFATWTEAAEYVKQFVASTKHSFLGKTVTDQDIIETTIARGKLA